MDYINKYVLPVDPEVARAINQEEERQSRKLELIASENFVSRAVMAAQGGVMMTTSTPKVIRQALLRRVQYVDVVEELPGSASRSLGCSCQCSAAPGARRTLQCILPR